MKQRTLLIAGLPAVVAAVFLVGGIVERVRAVGKLRDVAKAQSVPV